VGTMGVAGAQAASSKVAMTANVMNFSFIDPLLIYYQSVVNSIFVGLIVRGCFFDHIFNEYQGAKVIASVVS
jgi:hypothetical protein